LAHEQAFLAYCNYRFGSGSVADFNAASITKSQALAARAYAHSCDTATRALIDDLVAEYLIAVEQAIRCEATIHRLTK
jgi:hypothetical protein